MTEGFYKTDTFKTSNDDTWTTQRDFFDKVNKIETQTIYLISKSGYEIELYFKKVEKKISPDFDNASPKIGFPEIFIKKLCYFVM